MNHLVSAVLLIGGTLFIMVAVIGVLRLPDLYMRMHANTKAGTLGVGLIFTGMAVIFGDLSVATRAAAVIAFILLTAPVSAHMIGRAAYLDDVRLWEGTLVDELRGLYDQLEEKATADRREGFSTDPDAPSAE